MQTEAVQENMAGLGTSSNSLESWRCRVILKGSLTIDGTREKGSNHIINDLCVSCKNILFSPGGVGLPSEH